MFVCFFLSLASLIRWHLSANIFLFVFFSEIRNKSPTRFSLAVPRKPTGFLKRMGMRKHSGKNDEELAVCWHGLALGWVGAFAGAGVLLDKTNNSRLILRRIPTVFCWVSWPQTSFQQSVYLCDEFPWWRPVLWQLGLAL